MSGRLSGRRALVTAAGQGIGRAVAEAFAREGAELMATDLDPDLLDGLDCRTAKLDVLDDATIRRAVDEARPHILFNCAGVVHRGTALDATDEDWSFAFDLNVRSMFWTVRAALPGMLERGHG
ncbi:MAG TPA: SDR family NAD(P)-dependent oxidoreductase, partial [Thermohalobaculum sp.]|nr:SDR family NAD(P)-dependent oxidoreductase [Thermohalobaculum sp.]